MPADCCEKMYQNAGNLPLLNMITVAPGTALDIGCGAGDSARHLSERGWRITGITISAAEAEAARRFCERIIVADCDQGLPATVAGPFDLILISHLLEHLRHPDRLLNDCHSRLAVNGLIVVALPNVLHYHQRFQYLLGKFRYADAGILDETHLRFYTFDTAKELMSNSGFTVTTASVEGTLPWWKTRRLVPAGLRRRIDCAACRRWPGLFGHQMMFIAKPDRRVADVTQYKKAPTLR